MGDIGIEPRTPLGVAGNGRFGLFLAALIAVDRPQRILETTRRAVRRQLPAGHRHEGAGGPHDDLQIADHKRSAERDGAKSQQPLGGIVDQFDAYFCDIHGVSNASRNVLPSGDHPPFPVPHRMPIDLSAAGRWRGTRLTRQPQILPESSPRTRRANRGHRGGPRCGGLPWLSQ